MKKKVIALFLAATLGLVGCGSTQISSDSTSSESTSSDEVEALLADTTSTELTQALLDEIADVEVQDVMITLDEADWEALLADPTAEEYYEADLTIGDETVTDVAFRTKGASTLTSVANSDSDRYSFKINVDKYVDDQTILGTNKFVLNNSFSDPSYMREYLTYTILKELGADVPAVKYSNVYINGELFGFYLYVEAYDDVYVDDNTSSDDANLYKADGENSTLTAADGVSGFELKDGDDEELANITDLIETLENVTEDNTADLETMLDVDSVLMSMAVNYVCGNYDSYSGSKAHNYYLLYEDGQFTYLPWDFNMSFGGFSEDGGASISVDQEEHFLSTTGDDRPLFEVMLENDTYMAQYEAYCVQVASMLQDTEGVISALEDKIETYVENDPTAFYTYEEFEANLEDTDADLSNISSRSMTGMAPGMGGQRMASAEGQLPSTQEGTTSQDGTAIEGQLPPAPEGAGSQDGTAIEGQLPPATEGATSQDETTIEGQLPPASDGRVAQGQLPQEGNNQMGGLTTDSTKVSLYDYIEASIARILN